MKNRRACVYFDFKNNENAETRSSMRVYGSTVSLDSLIGDSEKFIRYGEEFYGLSIYFEDSLIPESIPGRFDG